MICSLLIFAVEGPPPAQTDELPVWAPYAVVAAVLGTLVLAVLLLLLRHRRKRFVYRGGIPDAIPRREMLYEEDVPVGQKAQIAEEYVKAGRIEDALEFFGYAGHREGLECMKAKAMKAGSSYMLGRVADFIPEMVVPEDWEKLAQTAERAGRSADAERARRIVRGDEEEEEETREGAEESDAQAAHQE